MKHLWSHKLFRFAIIISALLLLCLCLLVVFAAWYGGTPEFKAGLATRTAVAATTTSTTTTGTSQPKTSSLPTWTPMATYTPLSTYTPLPTYTRESTPSPSNTPQPAKNVTIGNPSRADSEQAGNSAGKGNDGDAKTRWGAADSRANHWWMVDLGALYDLVGSEVTWELDRKAYKYKVEASSDQTDWVVAVDQTQNTRATQVQRDSFTARGRYVRITVTSLEPGTWASFFEFSVFGRPAPTPTPTSTPTATSTPMPATATAAAQATAAAATTAAQEAIASATVAAQRTAVAATASVQATEAAATAAVQAAQATATAYACLNASYGTDVTVPDGTRFDANANFAKTWRVKNTGKCDWNEGVVIAFESGDRLDAPLTARVGALPIGQQIDISVPMRAPSQAGNYAGVWRMQDATGRFFGEKLTASILVGGLVATPRPANTVVPTGVSKTQASSFGDGMKIIGTEIAPGTYRSRGGSGCYWERLKGFGGSFDEIIANDNVIGPTVVTIAATDKGFKSSRCNRWTQDLSPITSSPTAPFGDATLMVNTDISPGTWRSSGGGGCYWERLSGFSGEFKDIIANDNVAEPTVVTISPGDAGFSSTRCGTWTKIQ